MKNNYKKKEQIIFDTFCRERLAGVSRRGGMAGQEGGAGEAGRRGGGGARDKEAAAIQDEFTEFSQYGSRFMLNQVPDTARKERNFVEQIQENKIFKKVASTCQKHYRKTSAPAPPPGLASDLLPPGSVVSEDRAAPLRREASAGQLSSCKDLSAGGVAGPAPGTQPTAVPRVRKTSGQPKLNTGEPEKFDPLQLERKAAILFKKAEQSEPSHTVSMHTDPRGCWTSRLVE